MSDEIVSRLMKNKSKKIKFLNEGFNDLYEADEEDDEKASDADDDYKKLNRDEDASEEEYDDSQAPEQGSPDDKPSIPPSHAPIGDFGGDDAEGGENPTEVEEPDSESEESEKPTEYENPLDNQYAVHFTLGDEVSLTFTGAKNSDMKTGVIEGYDPEGFYKVKWSDDSTTNGLTDIALESLVRNMKESVCVCGSDKFVDEEGYTICDRCGRKIRESNSDPLMLADKSRPKGKRMIRSEAHPVSTANKPNIGMAEAIRKALRGNSVREDSDPELGDSVFGRLKSLDNVFWTRQDELREDIEDLGYIVEEIDEDYVVVSSEEDEENNYQIPIISTSRTMTLDFNKAKLI